MYSCICIQSLLKLILFCIPTYTFCFALFVLIFRINTTVELNTKIQQSPVFLFQHMYFISYNIKIFYHELFFETKVLLFKSFNASTFLLVNDSINIRYKSLQSFLLVCFFVKDKNLFHTKKFTQALARTSQLMETTRQQWFYQSSSNKVSSQ